MLDIRLLLPFLIIQARLFPATQAAFLPLAVQNNAPTVVNPASSVPPFTNPSSKNDIFVFFVDQGSIIPPSELRTSLSAFNASVQAYLPDCASYLMSPSFEKEVSFPETTGDSVSVAVYSYGSGLSWSQLSEALVLVEEYMLGTKGSGHPFVHSQSLEFFIQLVEAGGKVVEVAHGMVRFAEGKRSLAKRLSTPNTLQLLSNVNSSSMSPPSTPLKTNPTLPIIYHVATNLDLNITYLGDPILPSTVLRVIESAYSDIILTHEDIDSPIPAGKPYSFTKTFGRRPQLFDATIQMSAYPGKLVTWGLLYLVLYGLQGFVKDEAHYNELKFEIEDMREGRLGWGSLTYGPAPKMVAVERLRIV